MKLIISRKKPSINLSLPSLCSFRTSKAYLWALVRERLLGLQEDSVYPLNILDAACHALITRDMFPISSNYFGLDISSSRLKNAFDRKQTDDCLFQANLCKPLSITSFFDVVVSCNTLSHLPFDQQLIALNTLISSARIGASLFINASIDPQTFRLTEILLNRFESVEVVYFESFLSVRDESKGLIDSKNVSSLINVNEVNVPNDASVHCQILFSCSNLLENPCSIIPPVLVPGKVSVLNKTPQVKKLIYPSDDLFLSSLSVGHVQLALLTSSLASSSFGLHLITVLTKMDVVVKVLSPVVDLPSNITNVYVLGLESEWVDNDSLVRLSLNRLREIDELLLHLVLVKQRGDIVHTQSLVVSDY